MSDIGERGSWFVPVYEECSKAPNQPGLHLFEIDPTGPIRCRRCDLHYEAMRTADARGTLIPMRQG